MIKVQLGQTLVSSEQQQSAGLYTQIYRGSAPPLPRIPPPRELYGEEDLRDCNIMIT